MGNRSSWRLRALSAMLAGVGVLSAAPVQAELIFGLTTTNALVTFDSAAPGLSGPAMNITGLLNPNESILGIDLRPATGVLYGLSSSGNLYTLNASTGVASFASTVNTALTGTSFGIDFNPTVDRLRITSTSGQNLRVNVATGVAVVDTPLSGAAGGLTGSAYTNNDNNPATGTTLYGINSTNDTLYLQNPPNNGVLTAIGALGFDTSGALGFDISGVTGIAYASLTNGDTAKSGLYTINLSTGAATLVGAFGLGGNTAIAPALLGISVSAVPEPSSIAMMAAGLVLVGSVIRRRVRSGAARA